MEVHAHSPRDRWIYPAISVLCFTVAFLLVLGKIWHRNDHHFVYALDDPYIHLALSRSIAQGFYGINPGEPASPSSSLLWPFLLAPFARWPWQEYVPLALNFCFGVLTAALAGSMVARWPRQAVKATNTARHALAAVALVLIGNMVGLVFVGMEHSLQVLLAGMVAWGITDCLRQRDPAWWAIAAAILLPSVRYECLDLTVALAIALIGLRRYRRAALLSTALLPLLGFGIFLKLHGLPALPLSVLVKAGMGGSSHTLRQWLDTLAGNLRHTQQMWVLLALGGTLAALAWQEPVRARRFAFAGAGTAVVLHLLLGRFGWMARYEVYIVFFAALVLLYAVAERPGVPLALYALGLFCCAEGYTANLRHIPEASSEIYGQQVQTSRFLTDYYGGDVAVADLGVVAYRRHPGQYVLDFGGLGSAEVALTRDWSSQFQADILREHHIGMLAIWPNVLYLPPGGWREFGTVCIHGSLVAAWEPCVGYFAPTPEAAARLRGPFAEFLKTLPQGDTGSVVAPADAADWHR